MVEEISLADYLAANKPKHKYFAKRTEVDGIWFDSKKEAERYRKLKILERCGKIRNLELQPEFLLHVNNQTIGKYVADFRYIQVESGDLIVEDCKGMKTPVYKLKKKLFEALYGRKILET